MISAKDIKINVNHPVKNGDTTMFNIGGVMKAVQIERINHDNTLKLMSCDLEYVWDNISISHWLKQVEFLKQIE